MSLATQFSQPSLDHLVYAEDFCDFASKIRAELLRYPDWKEMSQDGPDYESGIVPDRQNGITAGHLEESHRAVLGHCLAFKDFLQEHSRQLCAIAGIEPVADIE